MSRVICKDCLEPTCHPPADVPAEWDGYCPNCALKRVLAHELPPGEIAQFLALMVNGTGMVSELVSAIEVQLSDGPNPAEMDMSMTGSGQVMMYHKEAICADSGMPCVIHSPSDHHMREWPMHGRTDLEYPMIDRICPHDALHPDPDSLAWILNSDPEFKYFHGACDGCCKR